MRGAGTVHSLALVPRQEETRRSDCERLLKESKQECLQKMGDQKSAQSRGFMAGQS